MSCRRPPLFYVEALPEVQAKYKVILKHIISGHMRISKLEHFGTCVFRWESGTCNFGVWAFWFSDFSKLEIWNIDELRKLGKFVTFDLCVMWSFELSNLETLELWNLRTWELWNSGTFGNFGTSKTSIFWERFPNDASMINLVPKLFQTDQCFWFIALFFIGW